ncbi:MAG: GYF domain-containing protein [Akkermansiaceae bacterium]
MSKNEEWFYTGRAGNQEGPVSKKEIQKLISKEAIPLSAMVWKQGMENWEPITQIEELKTSKASTSPPALSNFSEKKEETKSSEPNPYEAPSVINHMQDHEVVSMGGIGRLNYFLTSIGIIVALLIAIALLVPLLKSVAPEILIIGGVIGYILLIFVYFRLAGARLKNTGMSGWFALMLMIPLVNIYFSWRCIAAPEAYSLTKKLDTAGIIITSLYVLLFIASIGLNILTVMNPSLFENL